MRTQAKLRLLSFVDPGNQRAQLTDWQLNDQQRGGTVAVVFEAVAETILMVSGDAQVGTTYSQGGTA